MEILRGNTRDNRGSVCKEICHSAIVTGDINQVICHSCLEERTQHPRPLKEKATDKA